MVAGCYCNVETKRSHHLRKDSLGHTRPAAGARLDGGEVAAEEVPPAILPGPDAESPQTARIPDSKFLRDFATDLGTPPLKSEHLTESDPLRSRFLVCGLAANIPVYGAWASTASYQDPACLWV
jgi:hypothetical protein